MTRRFLGGEGILAGMEEYSWGVCKYWRVAWEDSSVGRQYWKVGKKYSSVRRRYSSVAERDS